ncbi:hypothetical protein UFOVP1357_13 [uncultured Caudovirales phage]|uniref:Uncharacterized protein n=1 Tax=uncultured Caudovirales phage TaxID=2100421 RepID=A0A6J5RRL2_9CAUD|nr:hypothetical protein UFOVP18_1 [uncultured Caudovirales phage]CAB4126573.1 hypothetical protein UFOVP82_3 [uncultured Caudovirales phage]CAB4132692.1 hypothetical protein UFOVP258_52 [uncultured Caudovirales phage]CAB4146588.1 hypothetical protein UFOVP502_44 [uncultured Caudovirales phage]CAB4199779.1 hypothetical protein UFOVP1357_13 [uncultured Caudovirales phage]
MVKEFNTGFHDPIEPRKNKSKPFPQSVDRDCYEKLSGNFVAQGNSFGMGFNQPVGSESLKHSDVIPKGRIKTLNTFDPDN